MIEQYLHTSWIRIVVWLQQGSKSRSSLQTITPLILTMINMLNFYIVTTYKQEGWTSVNWAGMNQTSGWCHSSCVTTLIKIVMIDQTRFPLLSPNLVSRDAVLNLQWDWGRESWLCLWTSPSLLGGWCLSAGGCFPRAGDA